MEVQILSSALAHPSGGPTIHPPKLKSHSIIPNPPCNAIKRKTKSLAAARRGGTPLKICLTIFSSPWSEFKGGGQIAVHQLACALQAKGCDVHVIYSKSPGESLAPDVPYKIHWTRHYPFPTLNLDIFTFARTLHRLTKRERFDIIHGNAEESVFAPGIAQKFGADFVFTNHAPYIPATGVLGGMRRPLFFLKRLNSYLLRAAAGRANRIIAFSGFSRSLVVDALGRESENRVLTIPPGIDPAWGELRRNPDPGRGLIFWGRVEEEKGIPELLHALKIVAKQVPQVDLTLVGEGTRLEEYRELAHSLDISLLVNFTGWLEAEEIRGLAARARVGVFPSRVESFGMAAAEALAAGLPIIAARAGALPEIVEDGVTGTLVPPRDAEALARAILHTLNHPDAAREMAERGRQAARENFSWDTAADKIIRLYGDLRAQSQTP
ncbi:MAG: glycosyltransferase family 4 protein [Nitrospinaceae bacterium]